VNYDDNTQDTTSPGTCSGTCQACQSGSCGSADVGTDPGDDCSVGSWSCSGSCARVRNSGNCDGAGACDTDDESDDITANKVCSGGSEVDAGSGSSCDGSVDYYATANACTYERRYAECDGGGNCDTDADTNYHLDDGSVSVPSAKVAKDQSGGSSNPYQDANNSVFCQADGTNGACTFTARECGGTGSCAGSSGGETVNVPSSKVYTGGNDCTSSCYGEATNTVFCEGDASNGDCTFTARECGGGTCTGGSGGNSVYVPDGKVWTGGSDCTAGTGCYGDSTQSIYCGIDCTGGISSGCGFTALECGGDGSCSATGTNQNIPDGQVCTGDALGSPSSSNYCNDVLSCTDGQCSGTRYYRACGGGGSCRSDNTGADSASENAAAGKICVSNTWDDSTQSVYCAVGCTGGTGSGCTFQARECKSGGACDDTNTYYTTQNIPSSQVCTGNALGEADVSNYCGVSCTGGADSSCTFTALECGAGGACGAAGNAANIPDGSVCTGDAFGDSSSSNYCSAVPSNDNNCQYTTYYRECAGTSSCRSDNTGADSAQTTCGADQATKGATSCTDVTTNNWCDYACDGNCRVGYRGCVGSGSSCEATFRDWTNCDANEACSGDSCGTNFCDATWRCSSGSGDNAYDAGGDYYCQGRCDGSNNCDYAVNCQYGDDSSSACSCGGWNWLASQCCGDDSGEDWYNGTIMTSSGCCGAVYNTVPGVRPGMFQLRLLDGV